MKSALLKSYINQIKAYPLLTAEEEALLAEQIQSGSKVAYNKLVNSNLRLVIRIAYKITTSPSLIMDLIQEGNLGLMTAAGKYDGSFKTRFSTYAYPWITQFMLRYIDTHNATIAMPHRKEEFMHKIYVAKEHLFQEYGRTATEAEIAKFLHTSKEVVHEAILNDCPVSSLDIEVTNDGTHATTVGDLVEDNRYNPESNFIEKEEKEGLQQLVNSLPGNESKVIQYRYYNNEDGNTKTLREVSKLIGISPEAIRQTEIRALKRLSRSAVLLATRKLG